MAQTDYACGLHSVASLLRSHPGTIRELTVAEGREDRRLAEIVSLAVTNGIAVQRQPRRMLDRMLPGSRHQGIIATLHPTAGGHREQDLLPLLADCPDPPLLLVLDGVQDPHNLGACLRTADAAGVHAVIVPRDRAARVTSIVRKVASGAVESVPLFSVTNLARTLRTLREAGVWIYGASDAADQELYGVDLTGPVALVLGGEGRGLRRLTRDLCDYLVAIPMAGRVESLNVSVAAGVLLYEARRQRATE